MFLSCHIRHFIARMLLVALVFSMANAVVNRHYHRLANGQIIWHAHPFKKNKDASVPYHTHSDAELLTLDALSNPVFLTGAALVFLFVLRFCFRETGFAIITDFVFLFGSLLFFRRGPPSLSLS